MPVLLGEGKPFSAANPTFPKARLYAEPSISPNTFHVTSFFVGPNVIKIISLGLGSFEAVILGRKTLGKSRLSSEYGLTNVSVMSTLHGFVLVNNIVCN